MTQYPSLYPNSGKNDNMEAWDEDAVNEELEKSASEAKQQVEEATAGSSSEVAAK